MTVETFEFNGKVYTARHGGPFDRGMADSYYSRPVNPHYFTGDTNQSRMVILQKGTQAYDEYMAGYGYNEWSGCKKDMD